jgi:hypothetical protein
MACRQGVASPENEKMKLKLNFIVLLLTLLIVLAASSQETDDTSEPHRFFREYVGLNEQQIATIRSGKALARIVESRAPDEVFVFGAVYVESTPEKYVTLASNMDSLRKLPNYLAIQEFSDPPQLSDLDGFTLDEQDIQELKKCKPGHCEVQLPSEAMEAFQQSVDWLSPDAAEQVNLLAKKLTLEAITRYQQGGNTALGTYRDKAHPSVVADTFRSLLSRSKALPVYLPELDHYLVNYPNAPSEHIQSKFYWEKVNFGLKPTVRVVQAIVYRDVSTAVPEYAIAIKQLYASHYFETALDLTFCVPAAENRRPGFYLITVKGSQQAGLTGLKGGFVRKVAVDKTRSSLERALATIKQRLEAQTD